MKKTAFIALFAVAALLAGCNDGGNGGSVPSALEAVIADACKADQCPPDQAAAHRRQLIQHFRDTETHALQREKLSPAQAREWALPWTAMKAQIIHKNYQSPYPDPRPQ